jgi:iron complex outermembrane recepter protein
MKYIIVTLILLCSAGLKSQSVLSGLVKAKNSGDPLPGAVIYFPDLKSGTSSKNDGTFEIKNLPAVKLLVQIKLIGYKTVIRSIELGISPYLLVEMEESVIEADEVVVTGTSHATEIKRNPVPMISIDQKYLFQNTATNIVEAMVKIPGISAVTSGPNISKPYIRGLGFNRVLSLFDGVRQDGQQWGDEHGLEIDQYLIDRIEVVKGPASLIYGSDALAGVINFLPANPPPVGTIRGGLLTDYQTNNNQFSSSLNIEGNSGGAYWGAKASKKVASNYRNKYDGRVFGTKYNETALNAFVGLNKSWGYSHLNISMYDNIQEVPDGERDSLTRKFVKQISEADTIRPIVDDNELRSYTIGDIYQKVQHFRVYSSSNFFIGKSKLAIKTGYQQSIRQEFAHPEFPLLPGLHLRLHTITYDIKYYFRELQGWDLVTGLNGMVQKNTNGSATEFVVPDYSSVDLGPFALLKKSFGKLDLAAGIRNDLRFFRNTDLYTKEDEENGFDQQVSADPNDTNVVKQFSAYSNTFSGLSGSFGLTYNISEMISIKANVGRGYRAPNIAEISAKGIHPGTGFMQIGESHLKPEFNLQEDLGLFFESEHVSASLELFNNIISNYIYNEKLLSQSGTDSIFQQGGTDYPVFKFRQTKAWLYGGEFSFDLHPHPLDWLHIENSVSLINASNLGGSGATITDSTKFLPLIPPLRTNTELRAETRKKVACFSGIFMKLGLQYFAEQDRVFSAYGTETKTPGYTLLNAGLGANVVNKKGQTIFNLVINASNLTDVAYQNNMSRLKYFDNFPDNGSGRSGIFNMGRNFSFKIIIPLSTQNPG